MRRKRRASVELTQTYFVGDASVVDRIEVKRIIVLFHKARQELFGTGDLLGPGGYPW